MELLTSLKVFDVLSHRKNPFGDNVVTYGNVVVVSVSGVDYEFGDIRRSNGSSIAS